MTATYTLLISVRAFDDEEAPTALELADFIKERLEGHGIVSASFVSAFDGTGQFSDENAMGQAAKTYHRDICKEWK